MNYYHESMDYLPRTDEQIDQDLNQILRVTRKIKVYHNPFVHVHTRDDKTSANALEVVQNIVRRAKAKQMYVVWTENDDFVTLSDALWSDYAQAVLVDASAAHSAGADEFLVGNEISNHNNGDVGYNDLHLPERIKQLVTACGASFPSTKGYEEGWYKSESWRVAKLAPLDKIYFTLYEPWHTFKSALDHIVAYFGKNAELGEVSTMTTQHELHDDEQAWARDLLRRYDYARQKATSIWLFTFRELQNNSFGLFQANPPFQSHDIWGYLTKQKMLIYDQLLSNDFSDGTTQAFDGDGYNYQHRLRANEFNTRATAQLSVADYVFRGVARPISTSSTEEWRAMRLVFRYRDANNYYFVNIEPNSNRVQLFKRQDGVEVSLADMPTPIHLGTDYDFEIRIQGSGKKTTLSVLWNTVQLLIVSGSSDNTLSYGGVGMKNNGVVGELADVTVSSLEESVNQ